MTTYVPEMSPGVRQGGVTLVFTKDACMGCKATVKYLTKYAIPFETRSVLDVDPELRARHLQAPIVVAPDGREWSGFNPTEIRALRAA